MSTDFRPLKRVLARDLFDGRLEAFGVREKVTETTTERARLLTDGNNYLWTYLSEDGFVVCLTRYGPNGAPGGILSSIAEVSDTDIVSEYDPHFWGFDTQEEWDAAEEEMAKKHKEQFYADVVKHVRGEPNDLDGPVEMTKATLAKMLVAPDPELLEPANMDKLLSAIYDVCSRDQAIERAASLGVPLIPDQIAALNAAWENAVSEQGLPF